jgi:hypothetical protein
MPTYAEHKEARRLKRAAQKALLAEKREADKAALDAKIAEIVAAEGGA